MEMVLFHYTDNFGLVIFILLSFNENKTIAQFSYEYEIMIKVNISNLDNLIKKCLIANATF